MSQLPLVVEHVHPVPLDVLSKKSTELFRRDSRRCSSSMRPISILLYKKEATQNRPSPDAVDIKRGDDYFNKNRLSFVAIY